MQAIGNDLANRVWEHNAPKDKRPAHDATREQKESWIKLKYEQKRFLPAVPVDKTLGRQLIDAVISRDLQALLTVLPRCDEKDVNCTVSARDRRTPIHLACSIGSVELLQLLIWVGIRTRETFSGFSGMRAIVSSHKITPSVGHF